MKSETAFFKDRRAMSAKEIIAMYRFLGFTDDEIVTEMKRIKELRRKQIGEVTCTDSCEKQIKEE